MAALPSLPSKYLHPGAKVSLDRFEVVRKIHSGAFGIVTEVVDKDWGDLCVMKISSKTKLENLRMEIQILNVLQDAGSKHGVKMRDCGMLWMETRKKKWISAWVVMERVGRNLGDLRKATTEQCFSSPTVIRIGKQCIQALEDLHRVGYLHRDVKPQNFAVGNTPHTETTIYMLDFGLSRKFRSEDGRLRKPRRLARLSQDTVTGTRGYCTLSAHKRSELGAHDDLIGLMYSLVELHRGLLPWNLHRVKGYGTDRILKECKMNQLKHLQSMKESTSTADLFQGCPGEMAKMYTYLNKLTYFHQPDYNKLKKWLEKALSRTGHTEHSPYDWTKGGRIHSHHKHNYANMIAEDQHWLPPHCRKEEASSNNQQLKPGEEDGEWSEEKRAVISACQKIMYLRRMCGGKSTGIQSSTMEDLLHTQIKLLSGDLLQGEDEGSGSLSHLETTNHDPLVSEGLSQMKDDWEPIEEVEKQEKVCEVSMVNEEDMAASDFTLPMKGLDFELHLLLDYAGWLNEQKDNIKLQEYVEVVSKERDCYKEKCRSTGIAITENKINKLTKLRDQLQQIQKSLVGCPNMLIPTRYRIRSHGPRSEQTQYSPWCPLPNFASHLKKCLELYKDGKKVYDAVLQLKCAVKALKVMVEGSGSHQKDFHSMSKYHQEILHQLSAACRWATLCLKERDQTSLGGMMVERILSEVRGELSELFDVVVGVGPSPLETQSEHSLPRM